MNQKAIIAAVGALFLGLGGWFVSRQSAAPETTYRTAEVERKELRQIVSATGVVQPFTMVDIKSRAGGEILELPVEVGDRVKKGALIARVDPTDSRTAFEQAEADVSAAQARVSQAQQTLQLQRATAGTGIAEAEARVRTAEAQAQAAAIRLEQARKTAQAQPALTDAAIQQARASLESAQKQLAQLQGAGDPQARQEARSALATARANLENAEIQLRRQESLVRKGFVAQSAVDTATAQKATAQAQFDAARTRAETVGAGQDATVAAAQARVAEAREGLRVAEANRVQIELRRQDVRSAEAALAVAREGLIQARVQRDAARANGMLVGIRAADIATARAQIARSQASQRNTQIVLGQTVIRAPSDGVVLQKYVEKGTIIASGSAFSAGTTGGQSIVQLGDLTRIYVDALVDETDIGQVRPGQSVQMTFDAFPDEQFEGVVERTDPRGVTDQNVTTIRTRIELKRPDPRLRPGMNAECEFLVARKADVLVVPLRAVRTERGKKFVQVLVGEGKDAKPEQREVTIGMEASDSVEIVSGLNEGEKVVTATIQPGAEEKSRGGGGGSGGPGGGQAGFGLGGQRR